MKLHELGFHLPDYARLPSGLVVPTDVAAQTPTPLPPGLAFPRLPRPSYIQRRTVAPIDSIISWIDEPKLGLPPTEFGDLVAMVEHLPFEEAFFVLALLLRRLHPIRRDAQGQADLARELFGHLSVVPERIDEAISRERARLPFAEPLLIVLARMLIESAPSRSPLSKDEIGIVFERAVLGLASALNHQTLQGQDPTDMRQWLGFFMCKSNYVGGTATLNELVRPHELFRLMRGPLDRRAEAERCDVDKAMVEYCGLNIEEQFRLGMALAGSLHLWDDEGESVQLMRVLPEGFDRLMSSFGLSEKATVARDLIAGTRADFAAAFKAQDPNRELLTSLHLPFQQRPFLRLGDGSLVLVSPRFLHSWLTEGFHYRALDAVGGTPRSRARTARYLRFAGHVFERYCVEVAKRSHATGLGSAPIVSGDVPFATQQGESRTVDMAVALGSDLVLFEIEHHRPGADVSVRASSESAAEDIRKHIVGQIRALASCVEALRDPNGPTLDGIDMTRIRRIWPVAVSVDAPPQHPPLWDFIDGEVGDLLSRLGAEPLTILDAEDFETLCGLVEAGHSLGDLLGRKTAPDFARMDLRVWLGHDPLAPGGLRPERLNGAFDRLVADMAKDLPADIADVNAHDVQRVKAPEPC